MTSAAWLNPASLNPAALPATAVPAATRFDPVKSSRLKTLATAGWKWGCQYLIGLIIFPDKGPLHFMGKTV